MLDIEVEYTYQDKTRNELLCFGLQHIAKDLKYGEILTDGERKFSFMGYHFVERDHSDGKELITVRPMEEGNFTVGKRLRTVTPDENDSQ